MVILPKATISLNVLRLPGVLSRHEMYMGNKSLDRSGAGKVRVGAAAMVALGILVLAGTFTAEALPHSFSVEMLNVQFSLGEIRVDWADEVTIHVHNNDTGVPAGHTFEIVEYDVHLGTLSNPLPPGAQDTTTFTANQNGTFWYFCSVPGHSTRLADGSYAGMAGRLIVGDETGDGTDPDLTLFIIIGIVAGVIAVGLAVYFIRVK